jgi:hypothetical protein
VAEMIGAKFKDWVTLTLSILAFAVSVVSVYFSVVRQEDYLSVLFSSNPQVIKEDKEYLMIAENKTDLIFINAGNRDAAVMSVSIFIVQEHYQSSCANTLFGSGPTFATDFEPLVVKAKEIAVRTAKITGPLFESGVTRNKFGTLHFPILSENKDKDSIQIEVCANIYLSTPSTPHEAVQVQVFKYSAMANETSYDPIEAEKYDSGRPQVLVKNSTTIFGN